MVGERPVQLPQELGLRTVSTASASTRHRLSDCSLSYHFWLRIGLALIPDVIVTLLYLVLIFNPLHDSTYSLHPIFALVTSIAMIVLYANVCWLNPMIAYSNEVGFHNMQIWEKITWVETGFEVVLCLCWIAMMVGSCVAVHRWRIAQKAAEDERRRGLERRGGGLADIA
jgi:hypothetical protein